MKVASYKRLVSFIQLVNESAGQGIAFVLTKVIHPLLFPSFIISAVGKIQSYIVYIHSAFVLCQANKFFHDRNGTPLIWAVATTAK